MTTKIVSYKVEIRVPEGSPFDPGAAGAAILNAVKPMTGLPVMVTVDPVAQAATSIYLDKKNG